MLLGILILYCTVLIHVYIIYLSKINQGTRALHFILFSSILSFLSFPPLSKIHNPNKPLPLNPILMNSPSHHIPGSRRRKEVHPYRRRESPSLGIYKNSTIFLLCSGETFAIVIIIVVVQSTPAPFCVVYVCKVMYRKKSAIRTVLAFLSSPFFFTLSFCGFASLEKERTKERKKGDN